MDREPPPMDDMEGEEIALSDDEVPAAAVAAGIADDDDSDASPAATASDAVKEENEKEEEDFAEKEREAAEKAAAAAAKKKAEEEEAAAKKKAEEEAAAAKKKAEEETAAAKKKAEEEEAAAKKKAEEEAAAAKKKAEEEAAAAKKKAEEEAAKKKAEAEEAAQAALAGDDDVFGGEDDDEDLFGTPEIKEPKKRDPPKKKEEPAAAAPKAEPATLPVDTEDGMTELLMEAEDEDDSAATLPTSTKTVTLTAKSPAASSSSATATTTSSSSTAAAAAAPAAPATVTPSASATAASAAAQSTSKVRKASVSSDAGEEDTSGVKLEVTVGSPERIGDGMSSYIVYKVESKSSLPTFKQPESSVMRRYSDFYNLHKHLVEKYPGIIVPPPPPKDAIGTGVMKFKNSGSEITSFIERRAASLDRFMARIAAHPLLRKDDMLRLFLETEDRLPKPKSSALASLSAKLTNYTENDIWFDEKTHEIENLESQLKKTHSALEHLVSRRKELSIFTSSFAESLAALADAEEVAALTKSLHQLADVEAKIAVLHHKQGNRDFYEFSEIVHDYLGLISSMKDCFTQRGVAYKNWQSAESNLQKKKENEEKIKASGKSEKFDAAAREVASAEEQLASTKKEFETISKHLKVEINRFDSLKVKDFQKTLVEFIESMMTTQHQVVKAWEQFLPEAKAIGTSKD